MSLSNESATSPASQLNRAVSWRESIQPQDPRWIASDPARYCTSWRTGSSTLSYPSNLTAKMNLRDIMRTSRSRDCSHRIPDVVMFFE